MTKQEKQPLSLFRYRRADELVLDHLCRRIINFSSPMGFNDAYDFRIVPYMNNLTHEQIEQMVKDHPKRAEMPLNMPAQAYEEQFNSIAAKKWEEWRQILGVACFSARNDEVLMWAHYSGGKGLCLEFDAQKAPFNEGCLYKVKYVDRPEADAFQILTAPDERSAYQLLASKSREWKYEQEWRLFKEAPGERCYATEVLKAVYLGVEAEESTKERVRAIVKEIYPHAKLFQGRCRKKEFGINFDEVPL